MLTLVACNVLPRYALGFGGATRRKRRVHAEEHLCSCQCFAGDVLEQHPPSDLSIYSCCIHSHQLVPLQGLDCHRGFPKRESVIFAGRRTNQCHISSSIRIRARLFSAKIPTSIWSSRRVDSFTNTITSYGIPTCPRTNNRGYDAKPVRSERTCLHVFAKRAR